MKKLPPLKGPASDGNSLIVRNTENKLIAAYSDINTLALISAINDEILNAIGQGLADYVTVEIKYEKRKDD